VEIVKVKVRQVKTARQLTIDRGRFHYADYSHYQRRWLPRLHTCWPSSVAFVKDLLKHQQSTGNNQHSQYHSTAHQICSLLPRRNSKLSDFCYFSDSFFFNFFCFITFLLFLYSIFLFARFVLAWKRRNQFCFIARFRDIRKHTHSHSHTFAGETPPHFCVFFFLT